MNNLDIGPLQSLWYSGGGNTGVGTFVQELDRILKQIKNNIYSIEKGTVLSACDISSMYYIPAPTNSDIHTLYSLWCHCGGDTRLGIFITEVCDVLVNIADNISKICNNNCINSTCTINYDHKSLMSLWCSGGGSENLQATFVQELSDTISKIIYDIHYITVFTSFQ